jgi:phosphoglycolate phosphatase
MKTLVFDFDGTIADSFETLLDVFEVITKRSEKLTQKEIEALRGQSLRAIIKHLKIRGWQIPRMVIKAKKLISLRIADIETFANMPGALAKLNRKGYKMYILSTNSAVNIEEFLNKNQLDGYFAAIYGDIGLRSKSSALNKIVKREKLDKSDCYYIGDEVRDVDAAKKAGVKSIGVTWGFNSPSAINNAAPDFIAEAPAELIKILG